MGAQQSQPRQWQYPDSRNYAIKLIEAFGQPTGASRYSLTWEDPVPGYTRITVMDESVPHDWPAEHTDFVYSTINVKSLLGQDITRKQQCELAKASESILLDLLKQEATARCAGLTKNDVTLSFVLDYIAGEIPTKGLREEYARRIKENIITRTYLNSHNYIT